MGKEKKAKKDKHEGKRKHDRKKEHRSERKQSKKSKSKSKHRGSSRRSHESREGKYYGEMSKLLSLVLIQHPMLMDDIPLIMKSLDEGEYVDIAGISEIAKKNALLELMSHLPVLCDPAKGWYKESRETNVSAFIISSLSLDGAIYPSNTGLSMSQALASNQGVILKVTNLLQQFPDLKQEMSSLFKGIQSGNAVDLTGLGNEEIRDGLEELFRKIGLVSSGDVAAGYALPEGARHGLVSDALQHLIDAFEIYATLGGTTTPGTAVPQSSSSSSSSNCHGGGDGDDDENSSKRSRSSSSVAANENNSSSDSDSSDDDNNNSRARDDERGQHGQDEKPNSSSGSGGGSGGINTNVTANRIGPTMPSLGDIHSARALMRKQGQESKQGLDGNDGEEEEEEEEDDIGPKMADAATMHRMQAISAAQPLGFAGGEVNAEFERAFAKREGPRVYDETQKASIGVTAGQREDWMLTPGDSDFASTLTGEGRDPSAQLKNRKFSSGKQAKKMAEQISIQREFQRQQEHQQEQQRKRAAGADGSNSNSNSNSSNGVEEKEAEEQEQQPMSLMDAHLAKRARTAAASGGGGSNSSGRRAFDRDRDVVTSHQRMDAHKVSNLVDKARELGDRFSKSSVQKSFT